MEILKWITDNNGLFNAASAGVALVALFRPELFALIKKYFEDLRFYKAGRIEIGFSDFGPTLGMQGTFRSFTSDQFIEDMSLTLTRTRDSATYRYAWLAFREINLVNPQNTKIDVASPFLVRISECKPINILFSDTSTKNRFEEKLLKLRTDFENFMRSKAYSYEDQASIQMHINEFRTSNPSIDLDSYEDINDNFYWESGSYLIEISIKVDKKIYKSRYRFSLNPSQVNNLKLNSVAILQAAMYGEPKYNFAHPEYEE